MLMNMIYFLHEKVVRMVGKNLLARLHAIVFIVIQEKLIMVLLLAARLVDKLNLIRSFFLYMYYFYVCMYVYIDGSVKC
jgi:hypothetical protein